MKMSLSERIQILGEWAISGMYEEPERSLFYRKALGLRRYYENCNLAEYHGEQLYPSGRLPDSVIARPWYMNGITVNLKELGARDKELAEEVEKEFFCYHSTVPKEHTVAGDMYTHSMPYYERILREGLLGYLQRVEKLEEEDFREGLKHLILGIKCYIERCVYYLQSVSAEERLIKALRKVPLYPAETLYEALVGWNFIMYLDNCDNLGCLAEGLFPYYRGEDVTDVLRNLFDNLDVNEGYSMALGTNYNPLTLQCLEASKGKRRPMIELFVDENTPEEIWKKAFEVICSGNGQPAFYNPRVLLEGLRERFADITQEDVKRFCGCGCTESMLAGLSNVGSLDAGINLLLILEETMEKKLLPSESFAAFYEEYLAAVRRVVDRVTLEICNARIRRAQYNPVPMRTLLIDDCIEKATEYNSGGARYGWSIVNFAGLVNVLDSLLVIKDFLFTEKRFSKEAFLELLKANDEECLQELRLHKNCHGINGQDADALAHRLSADVFSMLESKEIPFGQGFLAASIQFKSYDGAGRNIGATPDGRRKGEPLCDSLGAIMGKNTKGPTAMLLSVAAFDLKKALGVPVLNFDVSPGFSDEVLKGLILGYMQVGGIQMQLSCISKETLRAAYEKPEEYRNLIVRVGGYSDYYCNLSKALQLAILERSQQV